MCSSDLRRECPREAESRSGSRDGFSVCFRPFQVWTRLRRALRAKDATALESADGDQKGGLAMQCDKSEYRGILAGLEGITGKKAVDSTTMTVKN